jgi:enoyl-CoA hydratase/carnithine racemase
MGAYVQLETAHNIARVVIDRPPANALNLDLWKELRDVFRELGDHGDISVGVLTGTGRGFSAGADLKVVSEEETPSGLGENSLAVHEIASETYESLYGLPCAMVCGIHGYAIGAGLGLATLCDIRIASAESVFSMPEINFGISVGGGGAHIQRLGVPTGRIREMMLTGRQFCATEALDMGLIDHVAPDGELDASLSKIVDDLAAKDPLALRTMKAGLNVAERSPDWAAGYRATHEMSAALVAASDPASKVARFFEKA